MINANFHDIVVLPTASGGNFGYDWIPNGACYRHVINKEVHLHLSLRNGQKTDGLALMSNMNAAASATGILLNREDKSCGYWFLNHNTQQLLIYGVTSNNILLDVYYYIN